MFYFSLFVFWLPKSEIRNNKKYTKYFQFVSSSCAVEVRELSVTGSGRIDISYNRYKWLTRLCCGDFSFSCFVQCQLRWIRRVVVLIVVDTRRGHKHFLKAPIKRLFRSCLQTRIANSCIRPWELYVLRAFCIVTFMFCLELELLALMELGLIT